MIGPVVTGVFVVGMVLCAAQRARAKKTVVIAPTAEDQMEGGRADSGVLGDEEPAQESSSLQVESREEKIASALVRTADFIVDRWSAFDERFALSGTTLKAIATVQEMDERNKVSETVLNNIKAIDEKYQVSEKAGIAVAATVNKAHELDASCRISESAINAGNSIALAGTNAASCVGDFERRYDISTRITTALIFTMSTLTEAISGYMHRIAANSQTAEVVVEIESAADSTADTAAVLVEEGRGAEEEEEEKEGIEFTSSGEENVGTGADVSVSLPEAPAHAIVVASAHAPSQEEGEEAESSPTSVPIPV